MGVKRFTELVAWQLAHKLHLEICAFLDNSGASRDRGFCDDIRRASRSAPANIAEGFGRYSHREFARYLSIARASLIETQNHLHAAQSLRLADDDVARLLTLSEQALAATSSLLSYLRRTPDWRRPNRER
jgi:four helix bundle protein